MELSEFAKKLEKMEMKYPGDASDALEKGAKKMLKALKKETPNSGKKHPHKLAKSWDYKMKDYWGKAPEANFHNDAPHYHLQERGIKNPKDAHGNPKPEWLPAMNKHIGFMEKIVKGHWDGIKNKMQRDFYRKWRRHLG